MQRQLIGSILLVLAVGANAFAQSARDEANALAEKFAASAIYLTGESTLMYHERVSFTFFRPGESDFTGHYSRDYLSPTQWRERYDIGEYVSVKVRNGQQQGEFRSAAFEPVCLKGVRDLLPPVVIAFGSNETLKKNDNRSVHGGNARCIRYENPSHGETDDGDVCFDEATGMLLSWRDKVTGGVCNKTCGEREAEWFDYAPYRERLYPRRVVMKARGRPILEASIEFTPGEGLKAAAFSIPQGFEVRRACDHVSS